MTSSGLTCDSSVLLPALMDWHPQHDRALHVLDTDVTANVAHVLVETYSAGTRLPEPHRASSATMINVLGSLPHEVVALPPAMVLGVLRRFSDLGVLGGRTYDGLIAATAVEHGLGLATMDRRATSTYNAVGVQARFLS